MIRLKMNPLTESATLLRRVGVVLGSVGLTALFFPAGFVEGAVRKVEPAYR